ncbi:MAG: hypothetical protein HC843_00310 [Sphingomonadales bacterium]|nr:hypothetical protein [Sphingomonadales bacterium]
MYINREIEKFLIEQDMPATKFGRLAAQDPRLVLDIRMGRELRNNMVIKLRSFMEGYRQGMGA